MQQSAYLSPRTLGEAIGVSQSSLKRWADRGVLQVHRTAGGHRRIERREALRFIRETGFKVLRPELLGLASNGELDSYTDDSSSDFAKQFQAALMQGDEESSRSLVLTWFSEGYCLATIFDVIFRPALKEIGEIWHTDPHGIAIEHRAIDICLQIMGDLRGRFPDPTMDFTAIGCAPSGDPYLLPSAMISTSLAADGVRTVNLGPNFPIPALLGAVKRESAQLVWLSVSHADRKLALGEEIEQLRQSLDLSGIPLVIGGAQHQQLMLQPNQNLILGQSISEVLQFARECYPAAGSTQ